MPDPSEPVVPPAITDEQLSDAVPPPEGKDVVTKMTHEVDTDDMFAAST